MAPEKITIKQDRPIPFTEKPERDVSHSSGGITMTRMDQRPPIDPSRIAPSSGKVDMIRRKGQWRY